MNRQKVGMILAEFLGTAILTSLVLAQVNAVGAILSSPWFVAVTAGLTLSLLVLYFARVSGANFNPAVTIGLWSLKKLPTTNAIVYIAAQMLGGICALFLFQYFTDTTVGNVAGSFAWRIFMAELTGTLLFTMGVAAAVLQKFDNGKAAFTIGASLTIGVILATVASNGILNPAVALGLNSWSWTYAAAPIIGGVLGMNLYSMFFAEESALKSWNKPVKAQPKKQTQKKKIRK